MNAHPTRTLVITSLLALAGASCSGATASGHGGALPVSAQYDSRRDPAWTPPAADARLYVAARAGGSQAGHELVPDAAMTRVAQALAQRAASDANHRTPAVRVIQAVAWGAGVIDPVPGVITARVDANAPLDELTHAVDEMAHDNAYNVVGVGRASVGDGSDMVAIALAERRVTLSAAIARTVHRADRVQIRGQLDAGLRNPELAITHPGGQTEHFPMGDGPDFDGQFTATDRGAWQVELIAEGTEGSTVVANFPVYVDMDPPATPEGVQTTASEDPTQVENELYGLINDSRRTAHLPPLERMPPLADVARAHSQDMAAHHFVGHVSPTTGGTADRVHRVAHESSTIAENLARGYGAREIHEGLMASPGHRANVLNARVTHVGIGAAREQSAGGGVVVTEDFIEVPHAIDVAAAPDHLLARINDARLRRGAHALTVRPQLTEVARSTANVFFTGRQTQQQVIDGANSQVNRFGLIFRRVAVVATVVGSLDDAGSLEPLMDPAVGAVGVGVAQGSRPDTPPNAIFVVYVMGYPR